MKVSVNAGDLSTKFMDEPSVTWDNRFGEGK